MAIDACDVNTDQAQVQKWKLAEEVERVERLSLLRRFGAFSHVAVRQARMTVDEKSGQ